MRMLPLSKQLLKDLFCCFSFRLWDLRMLLSVLRQVFKMESVEVKKKVQLSLSNVFCICLKRSMKLRSREPTDLQVDWPFFAVGIVEPVCCSYSGCLSPLAVTLYSHCSHWFLRSASWRRVLRGSPV